VELKKLVGQNIHLHGYLNTYKNKNKSLMNLVKMKRTYDLIVCYEIEIDREHHKGMHYIDVST